MLDTVILQIPLSRVEIRRPEYFGTTGQAIIEGKCFDQKSQAFIHFKPDESLYRPRVTLLQNYGQQKLKIEFSAPKLLFGNNFEELQESDFEAVIDTLSSRLQLWSIGVHRSDLMDANITNFHLGKNILFTDYTSASSMITLFGKADYTKKLDMSHRDYEHGGTLLRFHSNAFQIVLYDKIADLKKPTKRAVEKTDREYNLQLQLFDEIRTVKKMPIEIVRLEMRFLSKQRMRNIFLELGLLDVFTFRTIFRRDVWHALLLKYWDTLFNTLGPVLLSELTITEQFEHILRCGVSPQDALLYLGYLGLVKEDGRKVLDIVEKNFQIRSWYRNKAKILETLSKQQIRHVPLQNMDRQIRELKSLRKTDVDYNSVIYG